MSAMQEQWPVLSAQDFRVPYPTPSYEYKINAGRLLLGAAAFAVASYITIPIPIVDSLLAPVLLYGILIGNNFQDHNRVFKLFILTLLIDVILFFLVFPRVC